MTDNTKIWIGRSKFRNWRSLNLTSWENDTKTIIHIHLYKMSKEHLFELIRQDDVVLWTGAGLSMYAGYPSGKELQKMLYKKLKNPADFDIYENSDLDKVAQALQDQTMSKNGLTRILKEIFEANPKKLKTHKTISRIPHFKTIITTNYDKLFEQSYGNTIQVAIDNIDIQYLNKTKVELFKIHGCISRPDSIIITKNDYLNFTKSYTDQTPYWTLIKERIITRPILFLGYGLNDDNVIVTIDRLMDALGEHKRDCYFVAPKLKENTIRKLNSKNIIYINETADSFLKDLIENIKRNIHTDLIQKKVTQEVCERFIQNYDVTIVSQMNANRIVTPTFVPTNSKPVFNLKFTTDNTTGRELDEYFKSNSHSSLQLVGNKFINFEASLNGIRVIEEISEFLMSPAPIKEFVADIRFKNGIDIERADFKIFRTNDEIIINITKPKLSIKIIARKDQIGNNTGKVDLITDLTHDEICGSIKEEINLHSFLVSFGEEEEFNLFQENKIIFNGNVTKKHPSLSHWKALLKYFQALKKIELHYNLSFTGMKYSISSDDAKHVELIEKAIECNNFESKWDGAISMRLFKKSKEDIESLLNLHPNQLVYIHDAREVIINLHGRTINLGYITYIVNEPVFEANDIYLDDDGNECCKLYSKTNTRQVIFSPKYTGPPIIDPDNNIYINLLSE